MIFYHPSIDPIAFSFGIFDIRWYSLAYLAGFIFGLYLIKSVNKSHKKPLSNKLIEDYFFWSIFSVIIGGRIGYVLFYQTSTILNNPIEIFYIWQGGMSFHGGLIGIIFSMFFFSKIKNINFFQLSDLICLAAPIGIFFGRLANFINIELYGKITTFPFAIIYPTIDQYPRHPSQLYEAFFEGIIIFIVLYFYNLKSKNNNHGISTGLFLILYGVFRTMIEFIREPDYHLGLLFNLFSMGQLLSMPLIVLGIMIYLNKK